MVDASARPSTRASRVTFFAYSLGARLAGVIPPRIGRPLAGLLGEGLASVLFARRAQVERNLVRILGPMSAAELRTRTRRTFRNYGRYWYEFFRLDRESPASLRGRVVAEGYEHLERARAEGKGAIAVVAHIGGWDVAAAWLGDQGVPISVVVEPVEPPELFEWFRARRGELGMEVIPLGPDAGRAVARALRDNRVVALLADRDLTEDGVEVELFGERTTMPSGPALLAFRTGAPLLATATYFGDRGTLRAVMEAPLVLERHGRLREDVARVTQDIARCFERLILEAPEQWFVLQPNWPSDRT